MNQFRNVEIEEMTKKKLSLSLCKIKRDQGQSRGIVQINSFSFLCFYGRFLILLRSNL